jgi:predicted metallopeptidase
MPHRVIRCLGRHHATAHNGTQAPPWLPTGPAEQPFDFCGHVRRLCGDLVRRSPELEHIATDRLLFGITQARSRRTHGLQARVTPLRFRDGRLSRRRHGRVYQVQRHFVDDREILYLITFCLPRFLDQDFDDKFITLFHELYHISPEFNGDLRRHRGRCSFHSHSKRAYDRHMADLARAYLASGPNPELHAFLRMDFAQLQHRHGSVVGVVVPRPKVIPVPEERIPEMYVC